MRDWSPDHDSPMPLYAQIKDHLRSWIEHGLEDGSLHPHDLVPPERELCQRYGISRITAKRAIDDLVAEGLLYRRQGKGTFISGSKLEHDLALYSHTGMMHGLGLRPSSTVLASSTVPAARKIAQSLAIDEGAPVFKLVRLRMGDGQPLSISTSYLPEHLVPNLLQHDLTGSLFELLQRTYGYRLTRIREFIEPICLDAEAARLLGAPENSLGLLTESITFTTGELRIEYSRSVLRGDTARFTIEHRLLP